MNRFDVINAIASAALGFTLARAGVDFFTALLIFILIGILIGNSAYYMMVFIFEKLEENDEQTDV